jgi:SNF2 family DNA or RNA helicase
MIALDESHFCRNPQATQSKGLLKLKDYEYKIAMSGTPIVNNPLDAYTSLKWLGLEKAPFSTFAFIIYLSILLFNAKSVTKIALSVTILLKRLDFFAKNDKI